MLRPDPNYCTIIALKYQDKKSRDQAMYEAHLQYGYTLKDIAEYNGVHYTTVSKVIKRIEGKDEE